MTDIYSPSPPRLKPPKEVPVKKEQPYSSQQREQEIHQRLLVNCLSRVLKVIVVTV